MSPVRLLSLGGVLLLSLAACNGLQINRGDFLRRAMTTGGSTAAAVLVSQPQSASAAKTICIPFIDKGAPVSFECGPGRDYTLPDQQALKVKFDAERIEYDKKAKAAGYVNAEAQWQKEVGEPAAAKAKQVAAEEKAKKEAAKAAKAAEAAKAEAAEAAKK
uniref:PSI-F n=1 Tax=Octactis speculum TaxID=3111310 RepID=A0A7S2FIK2_9STRA|mmetsp:Transcript_22318/g.30466  ORF Transcript_22318/g.30466 Transcript_22318/m.30466 type:complete len:161 (+) Transcript_22318:79-561(+)|eukprot:CAMPEP_0185770492 /NCGR_PEP_ID=MMETSP1174-20130828/59373_1 /TAXON_ID=35687 /ORGANISM="Dictyocha speculum, Strain CCMP1381" /LENGTH=160 /DNA_ID=CAMNT_0028455933 /DNA_START=66 /DNA_END=548 /DNA_ORIENTATION=-